jgi:hypothetical protein
LINPVPEKASCGFPPRRFLSSAVCASEPKAKVLFSKTPKFVSIREIREQARYFQPVESHRIYAFGCLDYWGNYDQ